MQFPKNYLNKFQKETKKSTEHQEFAKELTEYFGKNCYWLPYKFEMWKLREKFKSIKELPKEKQNIRFYLGMLRK